MAVPAPQQIAPDVVLVTIGRGAAASSVYLVRSGSTWTLVDAAWAGSTEAIRTAAAALFGPGARPVAILLTHVHPDHSGAAGALARFWGVPVYVHADELPMAAGRYLPRYSTPLDRWVVVPVMRLFPPRIRARTEAATSITDVAQPLPPEGGIPGLADWGVGPHARAHLGPRRLPAPPRRVLLAGNAALTVDLNSLGGVLLGRQRVAGPPRYTTWDWPAAKRSVGTLAELEPRVLLPGHGPLTTGSAAALAALAQGRRRDPRRRGLQWLGFALTWLGLSPRAYMLRAGRRPGSAPVAREARDCFGISSDPTLAELGLVGDRYPVFRVMSRPNRARPQDGMERGGRTCEPCRTAPRR